MRNIYLKPSEGISTEERKRNRAVHYLASSLFSNSEQGLITRLKLLRYNAAKSEYYRINSARHLHLATDKYDIGSTKEFS